MAKKCTITASETLNSLQALFAKIPLKESSAPNYIMIEDGFEGVAVREGTLAENIKSGTHNFKTLGKTAKKFEVLFFCKNIKTKILWGTKEQFSFFDKASQTNIKMGANGEAVFQISNIRKFYSQNAGGKEVFTFKDLKEITLSNLTLAISNEIVNYMEQLGLSFLEFETNKNLIATTIRRKVSQKMEEEFGLRLTHLSIIGVVIANQYLNSMKKNKEFLLAPEQNVENYETISANSTVTEKVLSEAENTRTEETTKQVEDQSEESAFEQNNNFESALEQEQEELLLL